ncbi:MAG TPA: hypothetical protein DCE47_17260 [Planctomycetaceae bacterium]|nr:hypothetical protein [Planctomycetaceae bacterium]
MELDRSASCQHLAWVKVNGVAAEQLILLIRQKRARTRSVLVRARRVIRERQHLPTRSFRAQS